MVAILQKEMVMCFVLLVFLSLGMRADAGNYLALVSRYVQPGRDTSIPVKIFGLESAETETVTAQLIEKVKDNEKVLTNVNGDATAGEPDILLKLEVPANLTQSWPYQYTVGVIGSGAFKFSKDTRVYVQRPQFPVMVQMDKPVYKPGDMVKYRVFAIGENLDQIFMKATIHIYTPKGQKIEEVNDADAKPVYEGELPLAEETFTGQWRIEIKPNVITVRKASKTEKVKNKNRINAQKATCESKSKNEERCYNKLLRMINKNSQIETALEDAEIITDESIISSMKTTYPFKVEEYVLPNVFVNIDIPKYYIIGEDFLSGKLIAKYPNNRPVDGYAEITIGKRYVYGSFAPKSVSMSQKFTGTWDFSIPKAVLDRLTGCSKSTTLRVQASVTETVTGTKYDADSVDVTFHENPYKLDFHKKMPDNFIPGFRYDVLVRVSKQDGSPAGDVKGKVAITATFFAKDAYNVTAQNYQKEVSLDGFKFQPPFENGFTIMMETREYKIKGGVAQINDLVVPDAAETGAIRAEFGGQCIKKEISRFKTLNQGFLSVEAVEAGELAVGERVILRVRFSFANINGNYLIISKKRIVGFGSFHIGSTKFATIVLLLTRYMAPSARVVFYTVYKNELVANGIKLAVENMYENKVSPAFTPSGEVNPQSDVTLTVAADPGSLACVLLQDSRVRELGVDNDITRERVENALGVSFFPPIYRFGWGRIWPWNDPADDTQAQFNAAYLEVLTDLKIYSQILRPEEPIPLPRPQPPLRAEDALEKNAGQEQPEGLTREKFPETWLWQCTLVGPSGKAEIPSVVPDTITKWQANAFALNAKTGLGVAPRTADLIGNLKFYVKVDLSYSVVQNELIILSPLVFNYNKKDLNVRVTFFNAHDEFQGVELDEDGKPTNINGDLTRCILAKANSVTPVFFHFRPLIANEPMKIDVKIEELKSEKIFDQVIKYLKVKAEGKEMTGNEVFLISHKSYSTTSKSAVITYPAQTVKGSKRMRVAVIGDLLGATLKNIDKLLRMPSGCGEQTLINFVPAVMVARYLTVTNRFTPELRRKITTIIKTGYQRELQFKRSDGSFSAFGSRDKEGSSWLTAFVVRCLAHTFGVRGETGVTIGQAEVDGAVRYIIDNQHKKEGYFVEKGRVIHKGMQGGTAGSRTSLTAFVLIALQEVKKSGILAGLGTHNDLVQAIADAQLYLNRNFPVNITDYQAAIIALANPDDHRPLDALENSKQRTEVDGALYWKHLSRAIQVETAAYVLIAHIRQNTKASLGTAIKIKDWLIQQISPYGGFFSTQDTIVALQALEEIAEKIYADEVDMHIQIIAKSAGTEVADERFTLNNANHDVLQLKHLPDKVDNVTVNTEGTGQAMITIQTFYNVKEEPVKPSYTLSVETKDESLKEYTVKACARYLITNESSGMALLSIHTVTGYVPKKDGITAESNKRVEVKDGTVDIYYDEIPSKDAVCGSVEMKQVFPAAAWKEATVQVYSYYNPDENAMGNYIPKILQNMNVCKVCGEECGCGKDSKVLPMARCVPKKKNK